MKKWNYVNIDGNPTEPGMYWCTLIYDEWKDSKPTGRVLAFVDSRYLCDADKDPENAGWAMDDQPEHGLVWTSECGSPASERVWAWMPIEEISIADLPEGVEVDQ